MAIFGARMISFGFVLQPCNVCFTFDDLLMIRWRFGIIQSNWSVYFKIKKATWQGINKLIQCGKIRTSVNNCTLNTYQIYLKDQVKDISYSFEAASGVVCAQSAFAAFSLKQQLQVKQKPRKGTRLGVIFTARRRGTRSNSGSGEAAGTR